MASAGKGYLLSDLLKPQWPGQTERKVRHRSLQRRAVVRCAVCFRKAKPDGLDMAARGVFSCGRVSLVEGADQMLVGLAQKASVRKTLFKSLLMKVQ